MENHYFLMGKSTINGQFLQFFVCLPERVHHLIFSILSILKVNLVKYIELGDMSIFLFFLRHQRPLESLEHYVIHVRILVLFDRSTIYNAGNFIAPCPCHGSHHCLRLNPRNPHNQIQLRWWSVSKAKNNHHSLPGMTSLY